MLRALVRLPLPVWVVVAGLGLVMIGTYMVVPFYALYLTRHLGLSPAEVGLAMAVKTLSAQGLMLLGGLLADRFGVRRVMLAGLLVRVVAFAGLARAHSLAEVLAHTLLFGLAAGLYIPAGKAACAYMAPRKLRTVVFSVRNAAANVGVALGPMLGTWAARYSPQAGFYAAAAAAAACWVLTFLLVPRMGRTGAGKAIRLADLAQVLRQPGLWGLVAFSFAFWALYSQFELTMPLHVGNLLGQSGITLLFTVNALMVIVFQVPLTAWVEKHLPPRLALVAGCAALGAGFAGLALAAHPAWLAAAMVVFTVGEMLAAPVLDNMTVELAPRLAATALGFMSVTVALAGALGNMAGGPLYDWAARAGRPEWFWYGTGAVCTLLGVLVLPLRRARRPARRPAQALVLHWCAVAQPGKAVALRRLFEELRQRVLPELGAVSSRLYRGTGPAATVLRLEVELRRRRDVAVLLTRVPSDWQYRFLQVIEPGSASLEVYTRSD